MTAPAKRACVRVSEPPLMLLGADLRTPRADRDFLAPTGELTGTVGDDVLTVHKLSEGKPACGQTGRVTERQRAATCPECLETDQD